MDWKPFLDFGERIYRIWKGNAWNKAAYLLVFAGVTSITSLFQYVLVALFAMGGQRIDIPDTPPSVSFLLILLGLTFFALGRWMPEVIAKATANPNDVKLFREFRRIVTTNALTFMREHNFRTPFNRDYLGPFQKLAYDWRGARFQFVDTEVQKKFEAVIVAAVKLDEMIGYYTYLAMAMRRGVPR
jgi:hypothetical protein